jgi:hypothetical protein
MCDEHLADVRVADRGGRARLAPEARAHRGIHHAGLDELQRHLPFEPLVERLVDDTHAALAALAEDLVLREPSGMGVSVTRHHNLRQAGGLNGAPVPFSQSIFRLLR